MVNPMVGPRLLPVPYNFDVFYRSKGAYTRFQKVFPMNTPENPCPDYLRTGQSSCVWTDMTVLLQHPWATIASATLPSSGEE